MCYCIIINLNDSESHCVKSIQIRSFFWSVFSRIRTEYREIRSIYEHLSVFSLNARKYGAEKTSYLDTFHAVCFLTNFMFTVNYSRKFSDDIDLIFIFKKTCKIIMQLNFSVAVTKKSVRYKEVSSL